ncbi:hypothetical protein ID867_23610 [Streptomyces parvulus]|nr:hypothetical protein [Streptomyces parvulus]
MYGALAAVARAMPMTYAVQAAGEAATHSGVTALFVRDAVLILAVWSWCSSPAPPR